MTMESFLGWAAPLTLTGLVGAVAWIVKLAIELTSLKKDNETQEREIDRLATDAKEHAEWDRAQHAELFNSRNDIREMMAGFKATLETMAENVKEILERERARNGIGGH